MVNLGFGSFLLSLLRLVAHRRNITATSQQAGTRNVSFDETRLIKLSDNLNRNEEGGKSGGWRVRVTSFDNHHFILPSAKRNDHNQLF